MLGFVIMMMKKYVMEEKQLDESLVWGTGEDVEWLRRTIKNKILVIR